MSAGGSYNESKNQSSSTQDVWGQQSPYLQDLYGQAQNLYSNPNSQGMNMASDYARSNALQDTIANTQRAQNFNLDPNNANANPYLQGAMRSAMQPLQESYQNALSGITDSAVGAGQSGSSRQGIAEGLAAQGYMQQAGNMAGNMAYQNYGDQMNRMQGAVGQAQGVANLGMIPSTIQRGVDQMPWQNLANYQGIIGGPTTLGSSQSSGSSWGTSTQASMS